MNGIALSFLFISCSNWFSGIRVVCVSPGLLCLPDCLLVIPSYFIKPEPMDLSQPRLTFSSSGKLVSISNDAYYHYPSPALEHFESYHTLHTRGSVLSYTKDIF